MEKRRTGGFDGYGSQGGLPHKSEAMLWFWIGVGSLMLAGLFALILVIARIPVLNQWIDDPLFARRGLVIHVNLSLLVWLYGFLAALYLHLSPRGEKRGRKLLPAVALLGILGMIAPSAFRGVKPVLSNYIPALDHPLFLVGLVLFGLAVGAHFISESFYKSDGIEVYSEVRIGLRASAVAIVLALLTFAGSAYTTDPAEVGGSYYEFLFWGGGHVLQVASAAGMVSAWLYLLSSALKRPAVSKKTSAILFTILIAPWSLLPIWAWQGPTSPHYYRGATKLMQWAIFPAVSVFIIIIGAKVAGALKRGELSFKNSPQLLGLLSSIALTVVGFILGALIQKGTTIVPAHYHASIGGVTASYMTAAYLLLREFGYLRNSSPKFEKLASWQPFIFALGQGVFAIGFAVAKLGRKIYGSEQKVRTLTEKIGLSVMGLGGLLAVIGGILFLILVTKAFIKPREMETNSNLEEVSDEWQPAAK